MACVAAMIDAPQHGTAGPGPHPLPLFLDLVARAAASDADMARAALAGLRTYRAAPRHAARPRPALIQHGRARLLGTRRGRTPVVLVPSLINGASILDLAPDLTLIDLFDAEGYDALLVDWGTPTAADAAMTIDDHVTQLLLPMLSQLGAPVHLIGYCLGGTMAMATACLTPVASLTLLATPWAFAHYPEDSRAAMLAFWREYRPMTKANGLMPIAWLQRLFWGLDPDRTVSKYAALADHEQDHPDVSRFVMVEDWSNGGAPLTWGSARQLFEDMIEADQPGHDQWHIDGQLIGPTQLSGAAMQIVASADRIVPAATRAAHLPTDVIPGGHVGMIVGRHRVALHQAMLHHLTTATTRDIAQGNSAET